MTIGNFISQFKPNRNFAAGLAFLFWFSCAATVWAQGSRPELEKLSEKIHTHYSKYSKKSDEDPSNDGAKKMKEGLAKVWAAAERSERDEKEDVKLKRAIDEFLPQVEKFKTPDAKSALADLKALHKLIGGTPATEPATQTPATDPEPAANNDNASSSSNEDVAPQEPAVAERSTTVQADEEETAMSRTKAKGGVDTVVYLLFGVYFLAIILIAFILSNALKTRSRVLEEQIEALQKRLDGRQEMVDSSDQYREIVQKELKTKMEQLEANFVDYLRQFDSRLTLLEKKTKNAVSDDGLQKLMSNDEAQQNRLQHLEGRAKKLDDRLTGLEADLRVAETRLNISPAPIAPRYEETVYTPKDSPAFKLEPEPAKQPDARSQAAQIAILNGDFLQLKAPGVGAPIKVAYFAEEFEKLVAAVETLGGQTGIHLLEDYCDALLPTLKQATQAPDSILIDLKMLAQLAQMAYVSSLNEKNEAVYDQLVRGLAALNIEVQDYIAGEEPLADLYADNLTFEQFLSSPRVRTEEFPNYILAKQAIEEIDWLNNPAIKNAALFVLRPSVFLRLENSTELINRGVYVVKSAL